MRSFSVEPDQVVEQFVVEQIDVSEQQILMVGDELCLDASVKAFDMRIHLGGLRIGQPATRAIICHLIIEGGLELTSIVGKHPFNRVREAGLREPPQHPRPFAALVG